MGGKRIGMDVGTGSRRQIRHLMIVILMALDVQELKAYWNGIEQRFNLENAITFWEKSFTWGVVETLLMLQNT